MKVNAILLLITLFTVSSLTASPGSAQTLSDVNVSIDINNGTLRSAFSQIEKQTDFRFAYRNELIAKFKNLKINGDNRSVKSMLEELLKGTGLSFKQLNNSIIIFREVQGSQHTTIQDLYITGVVTDENRLPMPGVSVKIKGTIKAVTTDNAGKFNIQVPNENAILVFSYIGYITNEVPIKSGHTINISLKPDIGTLDDVVVIGYGTTTKRLNTGSVSSITAKDIANQPISNPIAALQGRVAGLDISGTSGLPGSSYNVRLRGTNSIIGGNDPLYIVDGIPFISESLDQFRGANGNNSPLNSINPADIERIDILKDADATAIYGSRGANGVILITTKKGKSGKTAVDAKVSSGAAFVGHQVEMLNTQQYLALRREALANDGGSVTDESIPDLKAWDQNLDNNWQDKLMGRTAKFTEAQLSLSGGSELTNFLVSGTYRREGNVTPGDQNYQRGAVNMGMNHKSADKKFDLSASLKYTADMNKSFVSDLTQYYNLSPNFPIYQPDGKYFWFSTAQNPIALFERDYESQTNNMFGNVLAKYKILDGLSAQVSLGYNRMTLRQTQTIPEISSNPINYTNSEAYYGNSELNSYIVEPQLDYVRKIGKGTLNLLLGGTFQSSTKEGSNLLGSNYPSDEQLKNPNAAADLISRNYNYSEYKYTSVFGRVTYNLDEKYILNGTFRRDGSSRFGPDYKFGNFGAIGAAWLFANEPFIKDNLGFLSYGKLRASYGTVGNDQIGDYEYYDGWEPSNFPYAGYPTLSPSRFSIPTYRWEVNHKLEVGLELGVLKDRILMTLAYYRNKSGNMLIMYPLSSQSGFPEYTANLPAELENKGFELELNTVNVNSKNFKWNTSFNLTVAKNKLLRYPGLEFTAMADKYFIGQPINVTTGFIFEGVNPETGLAKFKDLNGDQEISEEEDFTDLGTTTPKFYGGISNTLSYKNWSLDFFFQFVKQEGPTLNYGYLSLPFGFMVNKDVSALNRWTPENKYTDIPKATASASGDAYNSYSQWRVSSANWKDASYIRLKNVALRYNLQSLAKKLNVGNLQIFAQGQNLFTITNYEGFDPETKGLVMPPLTAYTAGLQLSF